MQGFPRFGKIARDLAPPDSNRTHPMALTLAQLTAFKDDIQANPDQTVIDALALGAHNTIANWYNGETADFWIFKQLVPLAEVSEAIELDDVANMTTGDNEKLKTFFTIRSS